MSIRVWFEAIVILCQIRRVYESCVLWVVSLWSGLGWVRVWLIWMVGWHKSLFVCQA